MTTLFDFSLLAWSPPGWGRALAIAFMHSLMLALGGYLLGVIIGVMGAFAKLYGGRVTRDLMEIYTLVIRAVPELVLIVLFYYVGTDLISRLIASLGFARFQMDALTAGIIVIGLVQGGYMTEVFRSAILAVPQGHLEAGRAFGMSPLQVMRRITLPGMMPHALPGMANLWMIATKDTALMAVIGYSELTLVARQAAGATRAYLLFFLAAGAIYLLLTLFSNLILRRIERRVSRGLAYS